MKTGTVLILAGAAAVVAYFLSQKALSPDGFGSGEGGVGGGQGGVAQQVPGVVADAFYAAPEYARQSENQIALLDLYTARLPGSPTFVLPLAQQRSIADAIRGGLNDPGAYVFQRDDGAIIGAYNLDRQVSLAPSAAAALAQQAANGSVPDARNIPVSVQVFATGSTNVKNAASGSGSGGRSTRNIDPVPAKPAPAGYTPAAAPMSRVAPTQNFTPAPTQNYTPAPNTSTQSGAKYTPPPSMTAAKTPPKTTASVKQASGFKVGAVKIGI